MDIKKLKTMAEDATVVSFERSTTLEQMSVGFVDPAQILKLIEMVEIMKDALEQYTDSVIPYAKLALERLAALEEK